MLKQIKMILENFRGLKINNNFEKYQKIINNCDVLVYFKFKATYNN